MTGPDEPEDDPTRSEEHPSSGNGEWSSSPADPPTEPGWARAEEPAGPAPASRPSRWGSRRVRVGVVGTLAALVLLGGGFGAGYAVADATAPTPAAHATAAKAHPRKGAAARRKQQGQQQGQQQGAAPTGPTI